LISLVFQYLEPGIIQLHKYYQVFIISLSKFKPVHTAYFRIAYSPRKLATFTLVASHLWSCDEQFTTIANAARWWRIPGRHPI